MREPQTREDDAVRVIDRFGNPDRLLSVCFSLVEYSSLGKSACQIGARQNSRKRCKTEPLTGPLAFQRLDQSSADLFGPAIVPREVTRQDHVVLGRNLLRNVPEC